MTTTALNPIGIGTTPGDNTGDTPRAGFTKIKSDHGLFLAAIARRATTTGTFGTTSAAGTTTTFTDSTQTWAVNQFAGQTATITSGALAGNSALIASNTANTITLSTALGASVASGVGYQISAAIANVGADGFATIAGGTLPSTIIDANQAWSVNFWAGFYVTLLSGAYAGQTAKVLSNTATALTLANQFATAIAAGSSYAIGAAPSPSNFASTALKVIALAFGGAATTSTAAASSAVPGISTPYQLTATSTSTGIVIAQWQATNDSATAAGTASVWTTIATVQLTGQPAITGSQTFQGGSNTIPVDVPYLAIRLNVTALPSGTVSGSVSIGQSPLPLTPPAVGNQFAQVNPTLTGAPVTSGRYCVAKSGIPLGVAPSGLGVTGGKLVFGLAGATNASFLQSPANSANVTFAGGTGLTTGSTGVTMTFSAATLYGTASDVGRKMYVGGLTLYVTITAFTSTTVATVTVTSGTIAGSYTNGNCYLEVQTGTNVDISLSGGVLLGTTADIGAIFTINDGSGTLKTFTVTTQNSSGFAYGTLSGGALSGWGPYTSGNVVLTSVAQQLPIAYPNIWIQLPAAAVGFGYPQGVYYAQMVSKVQALVYGLQLVPGQMPYIPTNAQLTAATLAAVTGQGGYTGLTGIANFSVPLLGGSMGPSGSLYFKGLFSFPANANTRTPGFYFGGTVISNSSVGASAVAAGVEKFVTNQGVQNAQVCSSNAAIANANFTDASAYTLPCTYPAIDTSATIALYPSCYLSSAADWMIVENFQFDVEYAA